MGEGDLVRFNFNLDVQADYLYYDHLSAFVTNFSFDRCAAQNYFLHISWTTDAFDIVITFHCMFTLFIEYQ